MHVLRHRPSPALVVACLALTAALGGTGYAAFKLPANSVGTNQLKNGAVVGTKVKQHSLSAANFKVNTLPPGPPGPPGARGVPGDAGPKGNSAVNVYATIKPNAAGDGFVAGPSKGLIGAVTPGSDVEQDGTYHMTFNQDVTNCAIIAMPGGQVAAEGEITAAPAGGSAVTVNMFDTDGNPSSINSFTVAVLC